MPQKIGAFVMGAGSAGLTIGGKGAGIIYWKDASEQAAFLLAQKTTQ